MDAPVPPHFVPAALSSLPVQISAQASTDPQPLEANSQKLKPQELDSQPCTGAAYHHQPVSSGLSCLSDSSGRLGATASNPNGHLDDRGNTLRLSPLLLEPPRPSNAEHCGGGGGGDSGADVAPTSAVQIPEADGTTPKAGSEVAAASGHHQAVAAA
ncbi:hypothetical protein HK405_002227 [Cladochytrium tenue]|nr:hypothetical protein HK405_002227 [Cladochytrium tenue]